VIVPTPQEFIREHIPYRLEILDSYCAAILLRITTPSNKANAVVFGPRFFLPTEYGMLEVDSSQLINLAFEAGLMSFRILLEFLGLSEGKGELIKKSRHGNDFGIEKVKVNEDWLPITDPTLIRNILTLNVDGYDIDFYRHTVYVAKRASTSSGHLVMTAKLSHWPECYFTSLALRAMVQVFLYDKLGLPEPTMGIWSSQLLHKDILASHRAKYAQVYAHVKTYL